MTLEEALARIGILQDPIPVGSSNRPATPMLPQFVTIHNTDNATKGADARAHGRYLKGADARARKVSWHFTVDDKVAVQSLPANEIGWHASTSKGNATSIGVEICMNEGLDAPAAYDRAALLAAVLGRTHGIAMPEGLRQHFDWSGKNCPRVLRKPGSRWDSFVAQVGLYYDSLSSGSGSVTAGVTATTPTAMSSTAKAKPVPPGKPVPFAASSNAQRYWPIVTRHPQALIVSCETVDGKALGRNARRFLANRVGGKRHHVGIDLFASVGDEVVACEDGKIVNFYSFYPRDNGEMTYAVLIEHDGFVANYGEVAANAPAAYGWSVGDKVRAGQRLARVSGTSMLHFETYTKGTKVNQRWLVGGPQPKPLLNPTQVLLDLAEHGVRIGIDGFAVGDGSIAFVPSSSDALAGSATIRIPANSPQPGSGDWHSVNGGREWRYDTRGIYTRERGDGSVPWRSAGEPYTCRAIWARTADPILTFAKKHNVNPALVIMTIAVEAGSYQPDGFTGPRTFRWESHVLNDDVKPAFHGAYSAGPMQTLSTTVRETVRLFGTKWKLNYQPTTVAPAIRAKPAKAPSSHPLYDSTTSIDLGCAEIRRRWKTTGDDPILVAAAYNAGGIYSGKPPWGIRAYGNHLDRAAEFYGDACAVLTEAGII